MNTIHQHVLSKFWDNTWKKTVELFWNQGIPCVIGTLVVLTDNTVLLLLLTAPMLFEFKLKRKYS